MSIKDTKQASHQLGCPFCCSNNKLFVTRLNPNADIYKIREHIYKILGVNVIIKCVSKPGAAFLSLGLFCNSVNDSLDFCKPGIWPKNTLVFKWSPKSKNRQYPVTASSTIGYSEGHTYTQAQSSVNFTNGHNSAYLLPTADQRLLHDQFNS